MIPQPQQIPSNWDKNHDWTTEIAIAQRALDANKRAIESGRTKGYMDKYDEDDDGAPKGSRSNKYEEPDYKEANYG